MRKIRLKFVLRRLRVLEKGPLSIMAILSLLSLQISGVNNKIGRKSSQFYL
jgi:hypothetical protein